MQGDSIVVEEHHRRAGRGICEQVLPDVQGTDGRYAITVAGESGSGKSETAQALADALAQYRIGCRILQQDDYFVYPPRSNDRARRRDIAWVGPQEVRIDVLDDNVQAFLRGATRLVKPLVVYDRDEITEETLEFGDARVLVAEGTYTTLLANVDTRVFIDRSYLETRAHREKRARHRSELDPFIDRVLAIEHEIISSHKADADLIITSDYTVSVPIKCV
jgi:uridine kinase